MPTEKFLSISQIKKKNSFYVTPFSTDPVRNNWDIDDKITN